MLGAHWPRSPLRLAQTLTLLSFFTLISRPAVASSAETRPDSHAPPHSPISEADNPSRPEQDNPASADPLALARLEARIGELEDTLELMEALAEDSDPPPASVLPTLLNAMNPRLTVFGDAVGRLDTRPVAGETGRIDNLFLLRETEVDFRASADPFVDGVVILSIEGTADGRFELGIEEGYALVNQLNLPVLHDPPLGLSFKVGRFRAAFGRLNQTHTHDLPQTTRPLVLENALGEDGLGGLGISARGFLPVSWLDEQSTLIFTVEGFGGAVPESPHGSQLVGMLNWTRPFGPSHLVELTAMGQWGTTLREDRGVSDHTLGAAIFYQWRPKGASKYHSFILSVGGLQMNRHQAPVPVSDGFFAFVQGQISRELFIGLRFDQSQSPTDPTWTRGLYPYLSWYPSEFFRVRMGWQHLIPEEGPDSGTFLLQINFIFGSHPPEPYWVSR